MYLNTGFSVGGLFFNLINLTVDILWLLVIVGLLVGLYQTFKRFIDKNDISGGFDLGPILNSVKQEKYACAACGEKLAADFKFCPSCKTCLKQTCIKCGQELLSGWKCCPFCGKENPIKETNGGEGKNE